MASSIEQRIITTTLRMIPNSRTPERGSVWLSSCEWNGRRFQAPSRGGAVHDLCRVLVAAGVPDMPMHVVGEDGKLRLTYHSIHQAAGRTIKEGARTPIRSDPFIPPLSERATTPAFAQNQDVRPHSQDHTQFPEAA